MATTANQTKNVVGALNQQVANLTVLFTKLHNYHWYVTGENFFELHSKLEEFYDYTAEKLDEVAERILALQGNPVATLKESLSIATIKEAKGGEAPKEMVQAVLADFEQLISELKETIAIAEDAEDDSTADLCVQTITDLQKNAWMLRAFLR
ncbi:Dps family protein [Gorillibacterium timonense]|uniref:Dps family protein n=1 Tax=Gorillibacterium timonense TaxID=1689269 RepID=UPI00071CF346|nr:Dps family protein [Gorillibacterium timonense]